MRAQVIKLLTDLWSDLHTSTMGWQIAVVAFCVLFSLVFTKLWQKRFPVDMNASQKDIIVAESFLKILFPGVLWGALHLGRLVLSEWQHVNLLTLLIPVIGLLMFVRFGIYLSRRIFMQSHEMHRLHTRSEKVFVWGIWLIAALYYAGFLQNILTFMDESTIFIGRDRLSISEILQAVVFVIVTVIMALWASAALDKRIMKVNSLHSSLRMVLSRLGRSLLIICAILISLNLVGIDLTVLSIFSGALGVGLGLGLQKIASNYVSGFIILLDRSLSINDLITVDKYSGKVSQISTRYTVLKGLDGVESIIPNEMLVSSPVQNLSLTDKEVWMSTDLTVAYSTNIETLLPLLVETVSNVARVSKKLLPSANLVNFGANGLDLRIGFWINDPENGRMSAISDVNRAIWKLLQKHKIEVPYPQTEIRVLDPVLKN